jgi:predicted signal transduction protein with EAL and GGDEF domain
MDSRNTLRVPSASGGELAMRELDRNLLERLLAAFCAPSRAAKILATCSIALGIPAISWFVYSTGGVKFATLHVMYLPVIFAALVFGAPGGLLTGALAGLSIGPFVPLDIVTGEAQQIGNWLYRTAFFCLVGGIVGVGVDTLRKQLKALDWLNDHDARTGLLDRTGLLRALNDMIQHDGERARPFLVVAQMNNFLDIQNTFGSPFGEKLLQQACERGRALLPADMPVASIQSDRLAAVFSDRYGSRHLRANMDRRLREPYEVDGVPVHVDFAIGAAEFGDHARTAEELLQKASIAMHRAATRKRPFHLYDSAVDATSGDNLVLMGRIPAALANNEFAIWHQAKIALASGRVSGTEALLRWAHPQRGLILPGDFIPQAEESTLINDLTQWVIRAALADMAAWTARGHPIGVAINLSVHNLHDGALFKTLHETVSQYGLDPQRIELEVTESAVIDDFSYCARLVSRLRDRGYRVSIDDFGTGHSSFAYLKKLPVCAIKIDRTFVTRLAYDTNDQKIVRAIIGLARSLDLDCSAEGIEDGEALAMLRDWGCGFGQGFFLHRPAPRDTLLAWLEDERAPAAARTVVA